MKTMFIAMFSLFALVGLLGLITQDLKACQVVYLLTMIGGSIAILNQLTKKEVKP